MWNDTYNQAADQFADGNAGPDPLASGGGKSVLFARPSYQDRVRHVIGTRRGVPDIAMSAACNGAVNVYSTFGGPPAGWSLTCGTSEATPLFAAIVALADQVAGHSLGLINPALYQLAAEGAPGIVDVTSGNNTVSFSQGGHDHTVRGFPARPAMTWSRASARSTPRTSSANSPSRPATERSFRRTAVVRALGTLSPFDVYALADGGGAERDTIGLMGLDPAGLLEGIGVKHGCPCPARDTLSACGGTINAAYFVPTPAVTSRFPVEPSAPLPACGG